MKYRHIVWDWNGTLLDDGQATADAVDRMLKKRRIGRLSLKGYQDKITFPIKQLYYEAGFDFNKESYEEICAEFIANYKNNKGAINIHRNAVKVLEEFRKNGLKQHIVSASEQKILIDQTEEYGLFPYFDIILGQNDHKAESKLHLAMKLKDETKCNPYEVLFIGDTTHDHEVAAGAGFDCVLVANGHCSRERLLLTGAKVVSDLSELYGSIQELLML